ncbi:MAG TPA: hypothetical protein VGN74_06270 [Brevundimonas sp.]|jgi:high-affinity Fe2+/Pb2+ permease|uniref:hypothetical protein n=1 Tax=Brevundimonas sp. TaxID=1871086 RepID=UPI002E102D23|nr:hypothetical protein [Brevundimonas sp.]
MARRLGYFEFGYVGPIKVVAVCIFATLLFLGLIFFRISSGLGSSEAKVGAMLVAVALSIFAVVVEMSYRSSKHGSRD